MTQDGPKEGLALAWVLIAIGWFSGYGWFLNSPENGGLPTLALSVGSFASGLGMLWSRWRRRKEPASRRFVPSVRSAGATKDQGAGGDRQGDDR